MAAVHLVTGGAGFVGANLVRSLLSRGEDVIVVDDLSLGRREYLAPFEGRREFTFRQVDCSDAPALRLAVEPFHSIRNISDVWHLAANSDIPAGVADPRIDLVRTFLTTFSLLSVMCDLNIPDLHFASSSAVYGDFKGIPTSEASGPLEPISNYGAMKLASEAQIRAAVESFLRRANIFRFPNVVGTPATHGVIVDLIRKCRSSPDGFDVLGDGTQQKIYLHVEDLIDAMLFIRKHATERFNVLNIGPDDEGASVRAIAEAVRDCVSPRAALRFGSSNRGWVGDIPRFRYLNNKLRSWGWEPSMSSTDAIRNAVAQIAAAGEIP